jgi:hypothetical protein
LDSSVSVATDDNEIAYGARDHKFPLCGPDTDVVNFLLSDVKRLLAYHQYLCIDQAAVNDNSMNNNQM